MLCSPLWVCMCTTLWKGGGLQQSVDMVKKMQEPDTTSYSSLLVETTVLELTKPLYSTAWSATWYNAQLSPVMNVEKAYLQLYILILTLLTL